MGRLAPPRAFYEWTRAIPCHCSRWITSGECILGDAELELVSDIPAKNKFMLEAGNVGEEARM
jgi:hypothetical protein